MTISAQHGVHLDHADAAYLVNALDEFARMMAERRDARGNPTPSQPSPRLVDTTAKLRRAVDSLADRDPAADHADHAERSEPPAEALAVGPGVRAPQRNSVDAGPHDIGTGDAARRLGITPNAARDLARRGRIAAHYNGTRWQFDAAAVAARAEQRASKQG
ncbi:helix-turn-helix domain-containing protein [Mycolicibacterium hodleri]|uniref:helix-turn-helix domain-containing protein n=1 Tax=Mycolicibacterium hodleri TaxID=49897 RepID=UPI00163B62A0|nr:helix-turn-helix domain-containing protein [Mycolicibacterium hodleri]